MPIIDERGRVFGRLNLVDAAIGALVLVLVPAAYGAYLLFKDPAPKLTAVIPPALRQGPNQQVEVRGEHFRPYMRVSFNDVQGRTFLFYNPTSAFVQLLDMPPGKYDVVLYDYQQEVSRLPAAFTVEPQSALPTLTVEVRGFLTSLTAEQITYLVPGYRFVENGKTWGEIVAVGAAEPEMMHIKTGDTSTLTVSGESRLLQLPVRVRTTCLVEMTTEKALRCTVTGIPLGADTNVQYPGLGRMLNLRVSEVRYPGARTAKVRVRFVVSPDVLGRLKKSDEDLGARAHPAGEMATLDSFSEKSDGNALMPRDERVRQAIPGRLVIVEGLLTVPVQETPLGWLYKDALVKAGAPFSFETAAYTMAGGIVEVTVAAAADLPSKPAAPVTPSGR